MTTTYIPGVNATSEVGETQKVTVTDAASAGGVDVLAPATVLGGAVDVATVFGGTTSNPHTVGADVGLPTISGGYNNEVTTGIASTIAGGAHHVANATDGHTFIGGGSYQRTTGAYSASVGGNQNVAESNYSAVLGGLQNSVGDAANRTTKRYQACGGGFSNDAKGEATTIAGGYNNTTTGDNAAIAGGKDNVASSGGTFGFIGGGQANQVSATYGAVAGGYGAIASLYGQQAQASGVFAAGGDAQTSVLVARASTNSATPVELLLSGTANRLTIATDRTAAFTITVAARRTDADNESAAYKFEGCIDNNAGVTALVGTVTQTVIAEDTAGWDCNVTASDANDALIITATGEAAKTIRWVARIELTEVAG